MQVPVSRYFKDKGTVLDPLTAAGTGHRLPGERSRRERQKVLLWSVIFSRISARSGLANICPKNFLFLFIFPEMAQLLQLEHPNQLSVRPARDIPKAGEGFGV